MSQSERLRIIVTGLIAQHPKLGGVGWDYVQYPVGLARLGHDVYYIEDSGEWPYLDYPGPHGDWVAHDPSANVAHLEDVLSRFGLGDRWAYRYPVDSGACWYGLPEPVRDEVIRTADLIINVSGTLEHPERYRGKGVMAYVDSDPVFTQAKIHLDTKFRGRVDAHDPHFTFGERLQFGIPETGHAWQPTRQPVLLDEWHTGASPGRNTFTTVMNWTSYKPLQFKGRILAQKDVELARFLDLPTRVDGAALEIALPPVHHVDWQMAGSDSIGARQPQDLLREHGWLVADGASTSGTLDGYRGYIQDSAGEWSVAKNGYVQGRAGWFSCRSACYLAAGRPVVVQDTGFGDVLPVGEGLLSFSSLEEAADGIRAVESDYPRHSKAAREIAEEYFDSDRVLGRLVEEAMA